MSFQYAVLTGMSFVASGSGAIYTHLTGSTVATASYIRSITIHNENTGDENVSLWVFPSGTLPATGVLPSTGYRFYYEAIPAGNTRIIEYAPPGIMLDTHGQILGGGTTSGSKVTVQVYGGKE